MHLVDGRLDLPGEFLSVDLFPRAGQRMVFRTFLACFQPAIDQRRQRLDLLLAVPDIAEHPEIGKLAAARPHSTADAAISFMTLTTRRSDRAMPRSRTFSTMSRYASSTAPNFTSKTLRLKLQSPRVTELGSAPTRSSPAHPQQVRHRLAPERTDVAAQQKAIEQRLAALRLRQMVRRGKQRQQRQAMHLHAPAIDAFVQHGQQIVQNGAVGIEEFVEKDELRLGQHAAWLP